MTRQALGLIGLGVGGKGQDAANWWEAGGAPGCIAAYQSINAADYAASKVNLANPGTYDATDGSGGAAGWTAAGWSWTSVDNTALVTGIIPAANWSMVVRFTSTHNGNPYLCGSFNGGSTRLLMSAATGLEDHYYYYGSGFTTVVGVVTTAVMGIAEKQGYLDGVPDGAPGALVWAGTALGIWIGAAQGISITPITGSIQVFSVYNVKLTDSHMLAISAAVAAL